MCSCWLIGDVNTGWHNGLTQKSQRTIIWANAGLLTEAYIIIYSTGASVS